MGPKERLKKMRHDLLNQLAGCAGAIELEMWDMSLKTIEAMRTCLDDMEREVHAAKQK